MGNGPIWSDSGPIVVRFGPILSDVGPALVRCWPNVGPFSYTSVGFLPSFTFVGGLSAFRSFGLCVVRSVCFF